MTKEQKKENTNLKYGRFTCDVAPVQADGVLPNNRTYYFRARHGIWQLRLSTPGGGIDDAIKNEPIANGNDPWIGCMPLDVATNLINSLIQLYEYKQQGI